MLLRLESDKRFVLSNGVIKALSGEPFFIIKDDSEIIVSDFPENSSFNNNSYGNIRMGGVSINGNMISCGGTKVRVNNGRVEITGTNVDIVYNGTNITRKEDEAKPSIKHDNEFTEYKIDTNIDSIKISSEGYLSILDDDVLYTKLKIKISGQGELFFLNKSRSEKVHFNILQVKISGQGKVVFEHFNINDVTSEISGQGKISFDDCNIADGDFSVSGQGSISGNSNTKINRISKSVSGMGSINFFR